MKKSPANAFLELAATAEGWFHNRVICQGKLRQEEGGTCQRPHQGAKPSWGAGNQKCPRVWSRDVVSNGLEVKTNLHPPWGTGCAGMRWAAELFPADPMTHGCWTIREWLRSEPNPLNSNPAHAKRQPAGNSTAVSLRTGTLGMCTGIPAFCNIYAHPRTLRMIFKNISRVYFFQIPCIIFFSPAMPDGLNIKIKQFYGLWRDKAFGFHKRASTFRKLAALSDTIK